MSDKISSEDKTIWMHSASLGEYQQGKPVLDLLKEKFPSYKIIITFFSSSGYDVIKKQNVSDTVFYMPLDTISNVRRFLDIVNPTLVLFVKYEFWFNYLLELQKRAIPTVFISSIFRDQQYFFSWYGKWFLNILKKTDYFFVQDDTSNKLLEKHGFNNSIITGDSRFDRVHKQEQNKKPVGIIVAFKANSKLLIAGSTWNKDIETICDFINQDIENLKFIIAPHEVNTE
ncbi:MAG: 3-deoxy-D-manno-octulosonic acid transferase, partial [Flavobacteriales bacterium]|nr:3-deoxy-D-manno-octulosonic acid transferase [Flavobacteriales bacterium]